MTSVAAGLPPAYYFGHNGRGGSGHNVYEPELYGNLSSSRVRFDDLHRLLNGNPDQGFAPANKQQGSGRVTHVNGWTVLAWWDYTGDSRPGSNSAVIVEGEHTVMAMMSFFRAYFPSVFNRQPRPLTFTP